MVESPQERVPARALGVGLGACGVATLTLLVNHPSENARSFTDFLHAEARDQVAAGIVHGGFIVTLAGLLVCFVFVCRYLGRDRIQTVLGIVAFSVGSGALMASMLVDGLVSPAIAVKFAGPADVESARTLMAMCGALVRFLMPMGIVFQGIAIVSFSGALLGRGGLDRGTGAYGLVVGVILLSVFFVVPPAMAGHGVLIAILLQSVWYFTLGVAIYRGSSSSLSSN
jgi:hypothetical protein